MTCIAYFGSAVRETLTKTHELAKQTGSSMTWCCCSAEVVGCCLYVVLLFIFVIVGFPFFVCWNIYRAIVLWTRSNRTEYREQVPEDPGGNRKQGYKTFENDDVHDFRNQQEKSNYLFYTNQLRSQPRGDFIDVILANWRGDYELLESHHGFIQWLFPLFERGVNSQAQVLTMEERQLIIEDERAHRRMLEAYILMLDFYGIILVDENTGEVARSENYRERFHNLNRHGHNHLRISRIIKCFEIFNYSHLAMHFVKFFITEIVKEGNLPSCYDSCMKFWIPALNQEDAGEMRRYAERLEIEKSELLGINVQVGN